MATKTITRLNAKTFFIGLHAMAKANPATQQPL
jgi:hypothetical protein